MSLTCSSVLRRLSPLSLFSMVLSGLEVSDKTHFRTDHGCLSDIFSQPCLVIPGQRIKESLSYILPLKG